MASPHSDRDELTSLYYGSPTSTLSSGYGQSYNRYQHRDDNLPEVAEVSSPQTATNLEDEYRRQYGEAESPDSPKMLDDTAKVVVPSELNSGVQYPQTAVSTNMSVPWDSSTVAGSGVKSQASKEDRPYADDGPSASRNEESKILGMSRKAFFILLAVILVIVVAAVGGGVGGAVAATRSKGSGGGDAQAATTTSATPTSTPPAATTSSTPSSSASATPTFLNNSTDSGPVGFTDGFAFQGFSRDNYTGAATNIVRDEGGTNFEFDIHSYVWLPNTTSCCVSFCQNATKEGVSGWRCGDRYQKQASGSFARIFVWCGGERTDAAAKCS